MSSTIWNLTKAFALCMAMATPFLAKGCGEAYIFPNEKDQEGMTITQKTFDNAFDDIAGIVGVLFDNASERTPKEIKEAGKVLSDTVKDATEAFNDERGRYSDMDALRNTAEGRFDDEDDYPSND